MAARLSFVPITVKVNLLIIATLVVGIGALTLFLATATQNSLTSSSSTHLSNESRTLFAEIETIMLPGRADLAQGLVQRLTANDTMKVAVFRRDGVEAFVDNATINSVNDRKKKIQFQPRENPGAPRQVSDPLFIQAVKQPSVENPPFIERVVEKVNGEDKERIYARVFKPLLNLPKCTVCHGDDHTVRGVLDIQFDITNEQADRQQLIVLAGLFFVVTVVASALLLSVFMINSIIRPVKIIGDVCATVSEGDFSRRVSLNHRDEVGSLASTVNSMIDGLVERFKLSKYVSSSTIQSLKGSEEGQRVARTLLFSDIRGFTTYSETKDPDQVVRSLNQILTVQTNIIHENGGDVDKYVGDEIVSSFEGGDGVIRAIAAAQKIQIALTDPANNQDSLTVGIGINYGEVILGKVGGEQRADYTVIGDTVNLASRLCDVAGPGEIFISEAVVQELRRQSPTGQKLRLQGPMTLKIKGKAEDQRAYKVLGGLNETPA